jgi:hypothetical protein
MKLYAHRGNVDGRNPEKENTLAYLRKALDLGFAVEVDVRSSVSGELYLGHDEPQELVPLEFLRDDRVITHAKDVVSFTKLLRYHEVNVFFAIDDNVALSSKGNLIHHEEHICPGDTIPRSIVVMGKYDEIFNPINIAGIISDEVEFFRKSMEHPYFVDSPPQCFKLLALDVDGVLTNGRKIYGESGTPVYKEFNDRDFTAIKRFQVVI